MISILPINTVSEPGNKKGRDADKKAEQEHQKKNDSCENIIAFSDGLKIYKQKSSTARQNGQAENQNALQ